MQEPKGEIKRLYFKETNRLQAEYNVWGHIILRGNLTVDEN